jgi:hypothetical protein
MTKVKLFQKLAVELKLPSGIMKIELLQLTRYWT